LYSSLPSLQIFELSNWSMHPSSSSSLSSSNIF
jgi:hypothetical protein